MTGEVTTSNVTQPRRRHHPFFYIGGTFLNAVLFAAVGPLVGGPIFTAVLGLIVPHSNALEQSSVLNFLKGLFAYFYLFFITIPVSYYFAASAAFATGAIVAVCSVWLTYSRYLYLAAASAGGIVSGVEFFRSAKPDEDAGAIYAAAIGGAVAAMVCTRIAKPFRLGVPVPTEPADGLPAS